MIMPGGAQGNQASTGTRQARSTAVGAVAAKERFGRADEDDEAMFLCYLL